MEALLDLHPLELLLPHLLGELATEESAAVDAHLATCASCRQAAEATLYTMSDLAMFAPPIAPPPGLRSLVLGQFEGGRKYHMFTEEVAGMLGLANEAVHKLFDQLDNLSNWRPGPAPGSYLFPVKSPKKAAFTGFIRIDPGVTFPEHEHHGKEHLFLIAGGYTDDAGETCQSGDHDIHEADTSHTITAMEWVPCICALVLEGGMSMHGS